MKWLVMGSCGFYGSRKAIFTRSQLDDSDESHLMKKKKKKTDLRGASSSGWGECEGSPGASLAEDHCQGLGRRSTLASEGQPRAPGDAAGSYMHLVLGSTSRAMFTKRVRRNREAASQHVLGFICKQT